jgi:hypothetical protein
VHAFIWRWKESSCEADLREMPCFYKPKKNGIYFLEGMPIDPNARPCMVDDDKWADYKLWHGDLYECRGCGDQIIAGVAKLPISEHYLPNFRKVVENSNPMLRVNDC